MLSTANLKSALAKHPQLSVTLLYAAGDIVSGLNQIAVSVGQAVIAATAVHNHLPPHRHSGSSGESNTPATADKMNQTLSVETEVQAAIP